MRFSTSIALVAAAIAPAALAQSVTIDPVTLTQCVTSTLSFEGSAPPYFVAVLPGSDPCTEDALAEYYDVTGNSVQYLTNLAAGTTVQIYVVDNNGNESWGEIETVGAGDGSCLPGASPSSTSASATSTSSSSSSSSSAATSSYVPPHVSSSYSAPSYTGDSYDNGSTGSTNTDTSNTNTDNTPANAADNTTNGASTLTASVSLFVGAFIAAAALL